MNLHSGSPIEDKIQNGLQEINKASGSIIVDDDAQGTGERVGQGDQVGLPGTASFRFATLSSPTRSQRVNRMLLVSTFVIAESGRCDGPRTSIDDQTTASV